MATTRSQWTSGRRSLGPQVSAGQNGLPNEAPAGSGLAENLRASYDSGRQKDGNVARSPGPSLGRRMRFWLDQSISKRHKCDMPMFVRGTKIDPFRPTEVHATPRGRGRHHHKSPRGFSSCSTCASPNLQSLDASELFAMVLQHGKCDVVSTECAQCFQDASPRVSVVRRVDRALSSGKPAMKRTLLHNDGGVMMAKWTRLAAVAALCLGLTPCGYLVQVHSTVSWWNDALLEQCTWRRATSRLDGRQLMTG